MPVDIAKKVVVEGWGSVPWLTSALKILPWAALLYALRWFFGGSMNKAERVMHGKVVMVTGGTSGLGAAIVDDLAAKGAQIILLVRSTHDSWLIDYISDLREKYSNELIYAEECDLSSLHSIRLFCTKWLDNSPPRRLDSIVLAAGVMAPPFSARTLTKDGVESHWGINYLANYHFLTLMSPSLRIQPPDRDVRVLVATCPSYMIGDLDLNDPEFVTRGYPSKAPWRSYGASKMALMAFVCEYQRQLDAYKRPDDQPMNAKLYSVDPGMLRSPGSRRWISFGSVFGLLIYVVTWPIWWLILKHPMQGAQSFFTGLYDPTVVVGEGGLLIRECQLAKYRNPDIESPLLGQQLLQISKLQVEQLEKASALARANEKKKDKKLANEKDTKAASQAEDAPKSDEPKATTASDTSPKDTTKSSSKKRRSKKE